MGSSPGRVKPKTYSGVIDSVVASSVVDRGFESRRVKPKTYSGVIDSMIASSVVDRGFESRSDQTKDLLWCNR